MGFEDFVNSAEPWDPSDTDLRGAIAPVRLKDSEQKADYAVVQRYLQLALGQNLMAPSPEMVALKDTMREADLRDMARNIFAAWLNNPKPVTQKGVFLLYGLHADDEDVADLWPLIMAWLQKDDAEHGAMALDGVLALSLSRSEMAPMIVEYISRTTVDENVRQAALEILAPLTENLSITWDELQDYIIPTLSFDDNGERVIEVGDSRFTAQITPFLTLELMDEDGVLVAVPPASEVFPKAENKDTAKLELDVSAKTDTLSADMRLALKQFYAIEKALNTVVAVQSQRLRLFMLAGRNWDIGMWRRMFMYSPILRRFNATLVWGVYEDQVLCDTFIFRIDDGSCTDVAGKAFDLDALGSEKRINPVHVFEMPPKLKEAWRARIAQDGVLQPLRQMEVELSLKLATEDDLLSTTVEGFDVRVLKGFDRYDCTEENRYHLESLGRILGVEGKELFMDIYYNGHRCLQERIYYPFSCEAGDGDMDAVVEKMLYSPENKAYPWLILALERNKTPYWLDKLYTYLKDCIKKRVPNAFAARGLLHADLVKYYDIARDTFILYWEENLPNDMGIYAFESNAESAVNDIVPYILKITPETVGKAKDISLQGLIQAAYRKLNATEFYDAFRPVYDNPATRGEFVEALMSRVKYYWHKRDLCVEMDMDVPVKQLLKLDPRWYEPFLADGLLDFIVHSVTKDMPAEAMSQVFAQLIERDFNSCEDLDAFYKYALGMMAMGYKDFLHDMLDRVKRLMPQLSCKQETLQRLAYHMEREATAYGDEFWLQQFILLDPAGFAGVFEVMREAETDGNKELVDRILKAIYEIVSRR